MDKKNLTVPNLLSVIRIILVPVFAEIYLNADSGEEFITSAAVLLFSGLTDLVDGKIARKYHQESELGKVLDPFADKLTQITVCLAMAWRHPALKWLLWALVLKEVLVFGGGVLIWHKQKFVVSPNIFGKIYTAVFYIAMVTVIAFPSTEKVLGYVFAVLLICNISTLIRYAGEYIRINKKSGETKGNLKP